MANGGGRGLVSGRGGRGEMWVGRVGDLFTSMNCKFFSVCCAEVTDSTLHGH